MHCINSKRGFTLIEIVVVLSIASLLLVVVISAIAGAQRQRRATQRVQTVGRVQNALESYASANGGFYGPAAYPGGALPAQYLANVIDPDTGAPVHYWSWSAPNYPFTDSSGMQYLNGYDCGINAVPQSRYSIWYYSAGDTVSIVGPSTIANAKCVQN